MQPFLSLVWEQLPTKFITKMVGNPQHLHHLCVKRIDLLRAFGFPTKTCTHVKAKRAFGYKHRRVSLLRNDATCKAMAYRVILGEESFAVGRSLHPRCLP